VNTPLRALLTREQSSCRAPSLIYIGGASHGEQDIYHDLNIRTHNWSHDKHTQPISEATRRPRTT